MFKVEIDFDEASREWMKNKTRKIYESSFTYCCGIVNEKTGKPCKAPPHHWKQGVRNNKSRVGDVLETKKSWGPCTKHLKN
jgi:hypothetical protein